MINDSVPGLLKLLFADLSHQHKLLGGERSDPEWRLWFAILSPRFIPVLLYRLAYKCQSLRLGLLARGFSLANFLLFGIEIAGKCRIGPGLFFPHTQGTVIGAIAIGDNAIIYHGVTLGAKDLDFTYDSSHRPIIGDNVMIGAGAKVLGGIHVGDNVCIAANAVLLKTVPSNVVVAGIPARIVKTRDD